MGIPRARKSCHIDHRARFQAKYSCTPMIEKKPMASSARTAAIFAPARSHGIAIGTAITSAQAESSE